MTPQPPSDSPELWRHTGVYHSSSYRANGEIWKADGSYRYDASGWHRIDKRYYPGRLASTQEGREEIAHQVAGIKSEMEARRISFPKWEAFKAELIRLVPTLEARNLWRTERTQRPGAWRLIRKALARKGVAVINEQLIELSRLDDESIVEFETSQQHTADADFAAELAEKKRSQLAAQKFLVTAAALSV